MSAVTTTDLVLIGTHLPVVEIVVFILLCYSAFAAGDCNSDERARRKTQVDYHAHANLMWIRIFAMMFCLGYFFKWLFFMWVHPGFMMPITLRGSKDSSNRIVLILFVVADWFRYSMLPAGTLGVILYLLHACQQLHGSSINAYLKNTIIGVFVSAMLFQFVFQYQTVTNIKIIDSCLRPMTCNPMWTISTCLSGWILWKANKVFNSGIIKADEAQQRRQKLLFRKLWAMFFGCLVAVIGRTIQLVGCQTSYTTESDFSFRFVKRVATWSVLITQAIVSWHSLQHDEPKKSAGSVKPSSRGSHLIRMSTDSNGADGPSHVASLELQSYISDKYQRRGTDDF